VAAALKHHPETGHGGVCGGSYQPPCAPQEWRRGGGGGKDRLGGGWARDGLLGWGLSLGHRGVGWGGGWADRGVGVLLRQAEERPATAAASWAACCLVDKVDE
jgi:hypothetical protein